MFFLSNTWNFFVISSIHCPGFTISLPTVRKYFWHLRSVCDVLMLVGLANLCGGDFYASTRPASSRPPCLPVCLVGHFCISIKHNMYSLPFSSVPANVYYSFWSSHRQPRSLLLHVFDWNHLSINSNRNPYVKWGFCDLMQDSIEFFHPFHELCVAWTNRLICRF